MQPPRHTEAAVSAGSPAAEQLLERFEQAWRQGPPPTPGRCPCEPFVARNSPLMNPSDRADNSLFQTLGLAETVEPIHSAGALEGALRHCGLLTPAQWGEVERTTFTDHLALARHLLERGWLTPYQANQLLRGRGRELILGPYCLLQRLGEGGTGEVFRAMHQK